MKDVDQSTTSSIEANLQRIAEIEKLTQSLGNHKIELEHQQEELERANRELVQARLRFDELRDSAPVAYFTHDIEGYIFEINKKARQMLGVQPCQKNIRITSILSPECLELFQFHVARVDSTRLTSSVEIQLHRGGVNPVFVLAETSVLSEKVFQTVMVDVSTRKRSEQVREQLDSELQQSQKMEVLHQLSGGVAHDFNNILQVLIFQSDFAYSLLKDENEAAAKAVKEICATAERGADLTRKMLAFSRKAPLEKVRCNLNEILENAMTMIKQSLGDIDCHFDPSHIPLGVWVDPVQVEQALLNLCLNSRDAMPNGGRVLLQTSRTFIERKQVKSDLMLYPGSYAVISVRDEGSGIPDEAVARIFEPFFSTKEIGQGTGLGMSIIHSILRQHGGGIEIVESNDNGTVIDMYLPSFQLPLRPAGTGQSEDSQTSSDKSGFSGTVLVCDDEITILSVLTRTLEQLGVRVLAASNGSDAIDIINQSEQPIDLLLTDVVMPEKDGRDVSQIYRQKYSSGAVVFMSGHGDSVLDEQYLRECNATFLGKPFKLESLEKKLGLNLATSKVS